LSATVFLITGFLDGQLWPWWDQVSWAFRRTRRPAVSIPFDSQGEPSHFSLGTEAEREAARAAFESRIIPLQHTRRLELLQRLPQLLETEIPAAAPADYAPLTWDEVRRLALQGIEFGAHTKTHPILSTLQDPAALREEIEGSKHRIETELGRPVIHFCYPNGRWSDFNQQTVEVVESCGFRTACTAEHGQNRLTANRYLLLRVGAGPDLPDYYFKERLAAIH
jgi:peptidoglycan/xylan/chitin deacetylase (PgdA/CDA1 family)